MPHDDMPAWRLEIPGWRPALLNELLGRHPMSVAPRKAHDRRILGRALIAYGVPRATGPRGVRAGDDRPVQRVPGPG